MASVHPLRLQKSGNNFGLDDGEERGLAICRSAFENIDMAIQVNSANGAASLVIPGNTAALIIGMPIMGYTKGRIALCCAI